MKVAAARNMNKEALQHNAFQYSRGINIEAAGSGQPVILGDAKSDELFSSRTSVVALRLASVAAIPLKVWNKVTGVLYLDNRFIKGLFKAQDLLMLETYANHAALALQQIR
jgi:GAF domain-containing protein